MKLEAVVVTEAAAEEKESRRAFAKTVHITALHANTKPIQPMRSSTGSCRMKGEKTMYFHRPLIHPHYIMGTLEQNLTVCAGYTGRRIY